MIAPWGVAMQRRTRKCVWCGDLFEPDPRNAKRQKYCAKSACRAPARPRDSGAGSTKPENQDYFRGPEHVAAGARVAGSPSGLLARGMRAYPGMRYKTPWRASALNLRAISPLPPPCVTRRAALQGPVLIGLIAHLSDSTLQDDIAAAPRRRLLQLGQDILSAGRNSMPHQTGAAP